MTSATAPVADDKVALFAQDGAVVIRGLFAGWVERLRHGIKALMADPSPLERSYHPEGDAAPFFQDLCNWQRFEDFRAFVLQSPAAETAAAADGFGQRAVLPRPRAGEGARHVGRDALAPGPAVLLRRRPAERQLLDPAR